MPKMGTQEGQLSRRKRVWTTDFSSAKLNSITESAALATGLSA
jgi:hypothetical protein